MRARRLRAPAWILLGTVLTGTATASRLDVELDDEAADLVVTVFERGAMNASARTKILRSDGYGLLFLHTGARSGRTVEDVRADFLKAVEAALEGEQSPGFDLQRIQADPSLYGRTLREIRRVSGGMRWRITDRLAEYLPPLAGFTARAHVVVGGSAAGIAFGDRDDVALRLDDFVPADPEEALDVDRLQSVLAHELFHVGFRRAGGFPPRPEDPDRAWTELSAAYGTEVVGEVWRASGLRSWDGPGMEARFRAWVPPAGVNLQALNRFVATLAHLQTEGCAVYVDAPLRDPGTTGRHAGEIAEWMANVDADFAYLALITRQLTLGASEAEIHRLSRDGLENNGPLYRVGYRMAGRIDTYGGRRPLLATIRGGPLEFFETYFQTHPYGPGQIDSQTEDAIRRLIREIRAVGEFHPEEG